MAPSPKQTERSPLLVTVTETDDPERNGNDALQESRESSQGEKKTPNMLIIFPAITIGIFLAAADSTIALVSYATISSELDALNLASWIMTAYALTLASIQPLYGKLCDIFGRKECLLAAYVLFALGCLVCGFARSIEELIAARVLQAAGGAGLGTVVSILLTGLVPLEDRGVWQAVVSVVYSLGAGLGAPLGGLLTASVGWRWAFFGQVPLCVIAIAVISVCLDGDIGRPVDSGERGAEDMLAKLRRVDFLGSASLIIMIAAFMFGLDRGSNVSWAVPETYGSFLVSGLAALWFFYVEMRVAREPILPIASTFSAELLPIYSSAFLVFFAIVALDFVLPLYYQVKDQLGPQQASLYMLPAIVGGVVSSVLTGFWMRHTGQYYWALMLVSVLQITGGIFAYLWSGPAGESTTGLIISQAVAEFGIGNSVVSGLIALISNGPSTNIAVMTAMYFAFRNLGSVLGVSVVSTVIQQTLRDILTVELQKYDNLDVGKIVDEVRKSLESLQTLDPEIAALVRRSYGQAMNKGFLLILVVSVAAAIPALKIRGGKKRRSP
ncbi:unnamed protein product [Clonostachys rosea f. rosea IK726]|uniref:Major facilitator superfamily (MFS) profile domain-containing protein n=2 Tax=Bionectria ochroleuca TaxID=29856 RepID=A0A0B7KCX1_BIOOC|nr:unnamed protein product [Clonostachys rosea f. rosea IK726]